MQLYLYIWLRVRVYSNELTDQEVIEWSRDIDQALYVFDQVGHQMSMWDRGEQIERIRTTTILLHRGPFNTAGVLANGTAYPTQVDIAHRDRAGKIQPVWWVTPHEWHHLIQYPEISYNHETPWTPKTNQHIEAVKDRLQ